MRSVIPVVADGVTLSFLDRLKTVSGTRFDSTKSADAEAKRISSLLIRRSGMGR